MSRWAWGRVAEALESPTGGRRIGAMEGLRGIAVALVFFVHYESLFSPWLRAGAFADVAGVVAKVGHTGVDVFFALSGLLIYGAVLSRGFDYRRFAWRRLVRIYPTFFAMFALYLALSAAFPSESKIPSGAVEATAYILANALLLPGLLPITPMITVAWSLSYEIFFYLSVPLAVATLGMRGWSPKARVIVIILTAVVGVAVCYELSLPHGRMAMFAVGMLVHELRSHFTAATRRLCSVGVPLAILALPVYAAIGVFAAGTGLPPPEVSYIRTAWLAIAILPPVLCAAAQSGGVARAFSITPLRWLGNMSYSYYLMHGLALKFLALIAMRVWPNVSPLLFWSMIPFAFAATLVPSYVLFVWIECRLSLAGIPGTVRSASAR